MCFLFFVGKTFGQGTPEKFSSDFINALLNYKEENIKKFISSDSKEQSEMLFTLKAMYTNSLKPAMTGLSASSSIRAVLKDGDKDHKQIADILIELRLGTSKYQLILWGCYVEGDKWLLGKKVELKKN